MADQFGLFWNSINSDRTYDADSFAKWLRKFFTTGIFNGEMQVTPGTGMQVNVAPGYANLNGKVRFFDAAQTFTLDPANGTYPRIDTIVVRADSTNRIITTEYVKGAYSGASPVAPAPVRTGGIYEIVLAQIRVGAGITAIMAQDITDTRPNDSLCGWVTSTVESVPMDQITTQMQADFLAWYDRMKGQLSEDAAGNLQLQIDETNSEVSGLKSDVLDLTYRSDSMYYGFAWLERSPTVHAYKKNDVFWWVKDGRASLVVAYEDISEGTTLVKGLNVENYTLGEAINALNKGLTYVDIQISGTTDTDGLLDISTFISENYYPITLINYGHVTTFFNGSPNRLMWYVRITDYAGKAKANTRINATARCLKFFS